MTEIICISCWNTFETDQPEANCPHCGFTQPGAVAEPGAEVLEETLQDGRPPAEIMAEAARRKSDRKSKTIQATVPPADPTEATRPPPPPPASPRVTVPPPPPPAPTPAPASRQVTAKKVAKTAVHGSAAVAPPPPPPPVPAAKAPTAPPAAAEPAAPSASEEADPFKELVDAAVTASHDDDAGPGAEMGELSAVSTVLSDILGGGDAPGPSVSGVGLEVPEKDDRWRVRTASQLILCFPTYDMLSRYLTGDEDESWAISRGPGPFRSLLSFQMAVQGTDDPVQALVQVPPVDEDGGGGASSGTNPPVDNPSTRSRSGSRKPARSTSTRNASTDAPPKVGIGSASPSPSPLPRSDASPSPSPVPTGTKGPGTVTARPRARTRRRRAELTNEFTFRTAKAKSPWPGRLLFLMLGLLAGGGAVYYVAWIGLLPGILY